MTGFLIGLIVYPVALIAVTVFVLAAEPGGSFKCRCGYSTGPMSQARLITGIRWRWHRASHRVRRVLQSVRALTKKGQP